MTLTSVALPPRAIFKEPKRKRFTFIDLFAGIGGFRVGLSRIGGQCVFTSEWDKHSQLTYRTWFGEQPHGDITKLDPEDIPDHDVLAAGFPCQPFSIAGVSKKNALGQAHGFRCKRQGNLFFTICDIARVKRPAVMILENVKNLRSHDKGRTWKIIRAELKSLNYDDHPTVIDAKAWVPQHRERIFIVCFDKEEFGGSVDFKFPQPPSTTPKLRDILEERPLPKYTLTEHLWNYLQNYAEKHRAQGNGFGFGLVGPDDTSRTLSARYYKDGSEILIRQPGQRPRRLSPLECARLMGFPKELGHKIPVSDTQAYRQFGNAVCPLVVESIGRAVFKHLKPHVGSSESGTLFSAIR
ncbi:DNA (cytosine-5-)-methyltransferase [soil metagenome]